MPLKHIKKKVMAYVYKEKFENVKGHIDPMEYHSMFVFSATLFNLMDYETKPWMHILPICTLISGLAAALMFTISVVHYVQEFQIHLITESGTYLLLMVYKLFMRWSMDRGKKYYRNLLEALRDDFQYISTKGLKYRDKFFENQKITFQACIFVAMFLGSCGSTMALCGCIAAVIAICHQEKGAERPLPYPIWLFDYDLQASPVYELIFFCSMLFTAFHTYQFIFLVQSQLVWIREITSRADIINWNLEDLLVDVSPAKNQEEKEYNIAHITHRMREIIAMHHSMYLLLYDYATVFKKCLLYEQLFASPIICLTAYCFVEKYEKGEIKMILLLLCVATIGVVYIPSYFCTHLLEKVQSVGDACWDIPFWNAGPVIGPYLILMMQRSMRQLPIVEAGFEDISLQTYSGIMTRAYSCFNMLRQADFNFD